MTGYVMLCVMCFFLLVKAKTNKQKKPTSNSMIRYKYQCLNCNKDFQNTKALTHLTLGFTGVSHKVIQKG